MTEEQVEIYRAMSPQEKLELFRRHNQWVRYWKRKGLKYQYPDWTPEQINRKLADITLRTRGE